MVWRFQIPAAHIPNPSVFRRVTRARLLKGPNFEDQVPPRSTPAVFSSVRSLTRNHRLGKAFGFFLQVFHLLGRLENIIIRRRFFLFRGRRVKRKRCLFVVWEDVEMP